MNIEFKRNLPFLKDYLLNCRFKNYGRPNNSTDKRIIQFLNFIKNCNYKIFHNIYSYFNESWNFNDFSDRIYVLFNNNLNTNHISKIKVKIIVYNIIVPILYIFAKLHHNTFCLNKLTAYIITAGKFEDNKIINILNETLRLKRINYIENEIIIQGYYYLYNSYCKAKKCDHCYLYKKLI